MNTYLKERKIQSYTFNIYLIIYCLLFAYNANGETIPPEVPPPETTHSENMLSYNVAGHVNRLHDDGYFNFNSIKNEDYQNMAIGYDIGVTYHFAKLFKDVAILRNSALSVEWTDLGNYTEQVDSFCSGQACIVTTSLDQQALMLNAYYTLSDWATGSVDIFAGLSHVWADGKINDEKWSDGALGGQLGIKVNLAPKDLSIRPYFSLRVLQYEIEQGSNSAVVDNVSFIVGFDF